MSPHLLRARSRGKNKTGMGFACLIH
jgi:hypothetical protein